VEIQKGRFGMLSGKLGTLNPLSVLNRGYSITFNDGKVVKDAEKVSSGDMLLTKLAAGEVSSRVE